MDIYFHGFWRMDWGLGNPNITAALIAMLMIGAWGLAFFGKWGFGAALAIFTGLGICLVHTFSRGGMVALGVGLLPVLWHLPRPWPRGKVIAVAITVWLIVGVSIYMQAENRYMQGIVKEDRSITNRLGIWKVTPMMMVSAPAGWGLGKASNAYEEWYQPTDRPELYLNLINTHLTWLVEIGWFWRFLYICGWLLVFSLCRPGKDFRWFAIPLGVWLSFAVAGIFSHVAKSPWLWIVPGGSLLAVLIARMRRRAWPPLPVWLGIAGVSAASLIFVYLSGSLNQELKIRGNVHEVIVGNESPKIWVALNPAVTGEAYGKTIRRYLQSSGEKTPVGITSDIKSLPTQGDITVVACGSMEDDDLAALKGREKLILLNPSFFPQEIDFDKSKSITVIFGEFSQSPALEAWRDLGVVQTIQGKGDFLANWPELIFNSTHNQ